MLIKFLANGQGDPLRAAAYVLDDKDHLNRERAGVEVLRGDPAVFSALAASTTFKYCYTSAVIAWANEDAPTSEDISEVLDEFEKHAFAGLQSHQYHMTAVMHVEDGGAKHVHILVPRIELTTGKSLNIAPPGHHRYFDPLRNYFNYKNAWARPDDPLRLKETHLPNHIYLQNMAVVRTGMKEKPKEHRIEIIDTFIKGRILAGLIKDRAMLLDALSEIGEISRVGKNYISLKTEAGTDRLKGGFYDEQFSVTTYLENRNGEETTTRTRTELSEDLERNRKQEQDNLKQLNRVRKKREQYNKQYYQDCSKKLEPSGKYTGTILEYGERPRNTNRTVRLSIDSRAEQEHFFDRRVEVFAEITAGVEKTDQSDSVQLTERKQKIEIRNGVSEQFTDRLNTVTDRRDGQKAIQNHDSQHLTDFLVGNNHTIYGEINDTDRIAASETRQDRTFTIRDHAFEQSIAASAKYGRDIEEYNQYAKELSRKIAGTDQDLRKCIMQQREDDQCISDGIIQRDFAARTRQFFTGFKTYIATGIKRIFDFFNTEKSNQRTGAGESKTSSEISRSITIDRLTNIAEFARFERRRTEYKAEKYRHFDLQLEGASSRLKKINELIKKYKFPKRTLFHHLDAITKNCSYSNLYRSLTIADEADKYIQGRIKQLQKNPYSSNSQQAVTVNYSRAIYECSKALNESMNMFGKKDLKHIYGFIETVKHYDEMLRLNHKDIEQDSSYFSINHDINQLIDGLKANAQQAELKLGLIEQTHTADHSLQGNLADRPKLEGSKASTLDTSYDFD